MTDNKVDRETLQKYADGPLDDAIEQMKNALKKLDSDASPQSKSYPPVGQEGAQGHQELAGKSSEMMAGCMKAVVKTLERLQDTIDNYAETEKKNTETAEQPMKNVDL